MAFASGEDLRSSADRGIFSTSWHPLLAEHGPWVFSRLCCQSRIQLSPRYAESAAARSQLRCHTRPTPVLSFTACRMPAQRQQKRLARKGALKANMYGRDVTLIAGACNFKTGAASTRKRARLDLKARGSKPPKSMQKQLKLRSSGVNMKGYP